MSDGHTEAQRMSDRARADENEKLVLQYHTENAELKAQVKKLEGWLGRGVSSNPHDHGMVCTGPIEGGPGMGWRPRTNDEWVDLMKELEARTKAAEKRLWWWLEHPN